MYTLTSPEGEAVDTVNLTWNHSAPLGGPVGQELDMAPSYLRSPFNT